MMNGGKREWSIYRKRERRSVGDNALTFDAKRTRASVRFALARDWGQRARRLFGDRIFGYSGTFLLGDCGAAGGGGNTWFTK